MGFVFGIVAVATIVVVAGLGGAALVRRGQIWCQSGAAVEVLRDMVDVVVPERVLSARRIERLIYRKVVAAVHVAASGRVLVPARFDVAVSEGDWDQIAAMVDFVAADLTARLLAHAKERHWRVPQKPCIEIRPDSRRRNGWPAAHGSYTPDPDTGPAAPASNDHPAGNDRPVGETAPLIADTATVPASAEAAPVGTVALSTPTLVSLDPARYPSIIPPAGVATFNIGRDHQRDLDSFPTVSATHCRLELRGGRWHITDVGSRNGTRLNGTTLAADTPTALPPGTTIQLASGGPRYTFTTTSPTPNTHRHRRKAKGWNNLN